MTRHLFSIVALALFTTIPVLAQEEDIDAAVKKSQELQINQDIAVTVNNAVHSWKESGGGAGTFSPNAAFIHGVFGDFFKGTTYTVKLQWKANKPTTSTQHIACGAGPIGGLFSPTRLSVQLINI